MPGGFQPVQLTPQWLQLLLDASPRYSDGQRLANKLQRAQPTVYAPAADAAAAGSQPPVLGLLDASGGSASFSVFAASDDRASLRDLCLALLERHQELGTLKFTGVSDVFSATIAACLASRGLWQTYHEPCTRMSLRGRPPQPPRPLPPSGRYYLDSLLPPDAQRVDDTWAYRSSASMGLVQHMIASYPSSCVRLKEGGQAVCWALEYPDGSMGMVYTLPEHRRLGLASACVQDLACKLLRGGAPEAFCFVTRDNEASRQMLGGLGFVPSGCYVWMAFAREGCDLQQAAAAAGP
jgi:GNAT superfamily N-acetyltransferase